MNNKRLITEIEKINKLMGINRFSVENLLSEQYDDLPKSDYLGSGGKFETQQKELTRQGKPSKEEKIGVFKFGNLGEIAYVKEGFKAFYLPDNFDIPDIFDLSGPQFKQDEYGWYEEFEKESWGTYTPSVVATGETPKERKYTIKRYFPTKYWSDLKWLKDNKIPIGFINKGVYYTLVIKLNDAGLSVFPDSPEIVAPRIVPIGDQSRGWVISFPGMKGSGSMDWGSAYYEKGTDNNIIPWHLK
jgi:hypothetical protein